MTSDPGEACSPVCRGALTDLATQLLLGAPRHVHDPKTVPEWNQLYGRAPTPAEIEIATRNREMAARLTWKPYMHNPRLGHFLPRVTNRTLIIWGREDRIVPVECGEQYRRLLPAATLTVLERCGHLPPIEQPDHFARLVLDFLEGEPRR